MRRRVAIRHETSFIFICAFLIYLLIELDIYLIMLQIARNTAITQRYFDNVGDVGCKD